jgi:hypothetical protein
VPLVSQEEQRGGGCSNEVVSARFHEEDLEEKNKT